MKFKFPKDFKFGAASSAVQIEASAFEGGKGEDIWQHSIKMKAKGFVDHDTNDGADFYHRYREDIKLMKELGLKSFRFSIAWTRVYPNGPDQINQEGIEYYHNVIDELIKNDIIPLFDLWHCDLPQWAVDRGGLLNPEFIDWFVAYAKTCFSEYGDKIPYWSTVNEPQVNIMAAYAWGSVPPFGTSIKDANLAGHHMILAHYKTVKLYREMGFKGKIGMVNHFQLAYGATLNDEDQAAAERDMDFYSNWYTDAIYLGHYPESLFEYSYIKDNMPKDYQKDLDENFVESDFIGINYYGAYRVKFEKNDKMDYAIVPSAVHDDYGFAVNSAGIFDVIKYVNDRYPGKELVISENGVSRKREGKFAEELEDDYRISYLREHLRGISRAISAGLPVTGYYHWSIMDTHEGYAGGFNHSFGLIQVRYDLPERTRTPKKSFYYYQEVIKRCEVE